MDESSGGVGVGFVNKVVVGKKDDGQWVERGGGKMKEGKQMKMFGQHSECAGKEGIWCIRIM